MRRAPEQRPSARWAGGGGRWSPSRSRSPGRPGAAGSPRTVARWKRAPRGRFGKMTQFLTPSLPALLAPSDLIPYLPPLQKLPWRCPSCNRSRNSGGPECVGTKRPAPGAGWRQPGQWAGGPGQWRSRHALIHGVGGGEGVLLQRMAVRWRLHQSEEGLFPMFCLDPFLPVPLLSSSPPTPFLGHH